MDGPRQVAGAAKPWASPTPPCTQRTRRPRHAQRNVAGSFRSTAHPTSIIRERAAPRWRAWPHQAPAQKDKHTDTRTHAPLGEKLWARPDQPSAVVLHGPKGFSCLGYKLRMVGILTITTEGLRDPGSPPRRRAVPTAAPAAKLAVISHTTWQALRETLGIRR